ncbi:MAG: glycosyltransferase [Lachnospiraceae bacterium]|nr:glycosyltransferase [Lachnospiraceae bacterium]
MIQKINKRNVGRVLGYFKRNGARETYYKIAERLKRDAEEKEYSNAFLNSRPSRDELVRQRKYEFKRPYKISILVPAYESDPVFFKQMLCSVIRQTYQNWELCIADGSKSDRVKEVVMNTIGEEYDPLVGSRVKYQKLSENKGISGNSNAALEMANGDYIALLDHDDILEEDALFQVMMILEDSAYKDGNLTLNRALMVYSDEDKVSSDSNRFFDYHSKPDFDIDLLRSNNYICHFLVVDSNIAKKTGGFREKYDGAQDHDFIFRCVEQLSPENIRHIDKVLYHWRASEGSTADNPDSKLYAYMAARKAIEAHLRRVGVEADVYETSHLGFFRVQYHNEGLKCIRMSRKKYEALSLEEIRALDTDAIMVLGENIMPLHRNYIEEFLGILSRKEVTAVGGKILYKHNKVDNVGYSYDEEGKLRPEYRGVNMHFSGYMHRALIQHESAALSPDCFMVKKEALLKYGKDLKNENCIFVSDPFIMFRRK